MELLEPIAMFFTCCCQCSLGLWWCTFMTAIRWVGRLEKYCSVLHSALRPKTKFYLWDNKVDVTDWLNMHKGWFWSTWMKGAGAHVRALSLLFICGLLLTNPYISTCSSSCLLHLKHIGLLFLSTAMSRAAETIIAPKKTQLFNVHPN